MSVRLIPLNLGLENQDINEAIVGTTAPPLCSSKGGTAHGEQERNFKLVIRGQKRKEPNGHTSGKRREITTTITCLLQRATVWCVQMEVPTVKPAQLKYSRDVLLDNVMRWYTNYLAVNLTELNQQMHPKRNDCHVVFRFPVRQFTTGLEKSSLLWLFAGLNTCTLPRRKRICRWTCFSQRKFCTLPHVFLQFWHQQKEFFSWQPLWKLI